MEPGRPSATAEGAALLRAAHQLFDAPTVLDDPVVLRLLGPEHEARLRAHPAAVDEGDRRPLRAAIAARSRFAEDCLREAVARGVGQYVVLGAGLDSFAYRNPFPPAALHVYEVDHPDTQAWKRSRLAAAGIPLPTSLTFVPVDFERDTLPDALAAHGFDATRPAFVSWLGVTVYLTREAVWETLAWVASLAAGSEIVFTYLPEPSSLGARSHAALDALGARVAAGGEPWRTFFAPDELARGLVARGFGRIEDLGPEAIHARYFRGRADGLRPGGSVHFLRATRPG